MTYFMRKSTIAAFALAGMLSATMLPRAVHADTPVSASGFTASYPCIQSNSIPVPSDYPINAPPPQAVLDQINASMHANRFTCYSVSRGTPDAISSALQRATATENAAMANTITADDAQGCTNQEYYVGYLEQHVGTGYYGQNSYVDLSIVVQRPCRVQFA